MFMWGKYKDGHNYVNWVGGWLFDKRSIDKMSDGKGRRVKVFFNFAVKQDTNLFLQFRTLAV